MKMEQRQCSETSAYKIQMLGNNPEESIQDLVCSAHGNCCNDGAGCSMKQVSTTSRMTTAQWVIMIWQSSDSMQCLGKDSNGCLCTSASCTDQKFLLPSTFCASYYPFWMNNYGAPADLLHGKKMSPCHIQSSTWRTAFELNAYLKFNTVTWFCRTTIYVKLNLASPLCCFVTMCCGVHPDLLHLQYSPLKHRTFYCNATTLLTAHFLPLSPRL